MDNKTLFDSIEDDASQQHLPEALATPSQPTETTDTGVELFEPKMSDESQEAYENRVGVKKEFDGRIVTVKRMQVQPPRRFKMENGVKVPKPPLTGKTNKNARYYNSKVKVWFVEENLVDFYPSVTFWVRPDGSISEDVRIQRNVHNVLSILSRLILQHMAKTFEDGKYQFRLVESTFNERPTLIVHKDDEKLFAEFERKISDTTLLKYLEGKKVKLKCKKGTYLGDDWFRNDICEIIG